MDDTSQALQRIARGAGIVFIGTIISMLLGFLTRTLIARYFSVGEYGVFNLTLTVLNISLIIATFGFQGALPREIAYHRQKNRLKIDTLISTAISIILVNALILTALIVLESGSIARVFNDERISYSLKIGIFSLPFWALNAVIISVSRGFSRVRELVYFQNVGYPALFFVSVVSVVYLNLPFNYVFVAYVMAQGLTLLLLILDVHRTGLFTPKISADFHVAKQLASFSLPLMLTGILNLVMIWADTLMLGYFKSSEVVGLYNAATPLARLIPIFLSSMAVIFSPIATSLYARGKIAEMERVYQITTKWIFLLTLPIFSMMLLFPEAVIRFFFGEKYVSSAQVLQILSIGFAVHTLLGLNGISLVVVGRPRLNMVGDAFAVVSNILLNVLLIPTYGMIGAGVATATSYIIANVFRSLWLYHSVRIHPFGLTYVKPLVISFVLLGVIKSLNLRVVSIWYAIPILLVFLVLYALLVLLSRSVDREDIELMLAIEKRMGIEFGFLKKVLKKFI